MKKRWICALCIAFVLILLGGCGKKTEVVQGNADKNEKEFFLAKNDEMDDATRTEVNKIVEVFTKSVETQDAKDLIKYIDRDFQITQATLNNFLKQVQDMNANPFTQYDSYYVRGMKVGTTSVRIKKNKEAKNAIELIPGSEEMYAVMLASENKEVSYMISLLCAKMKNEWKIVWIDISDFKYNGLDAPVIYEKSTALKKEGKVMPAYIYSMMLYNVITPGNILYYPNSDQMQDFYYQMQRDVWGEKKLPIKLGTGEKPLLHGVGLSKEEMGIIPMILFETNTPITNKAAIEKEAKTVRDAFNKLYPGLPENFSHIALRATNQNPKEVGEKLKYESIILPTK